jgi:hypothetical protein
MEMMAGDLAGARMRAEGGRGEEILPAPLAGGIRVSGESLWPRGLRRLFQLHQTESGEPHAPVHVGFLSGVCVACQSDGPAKSIDDAGNFHVSVRQGSGIACRWQHGTNRNVFTTERPVVRFQGAGLIGQSSPIEGGCPWEGEDIAGENTGCIHGLPELPIGQMGGTAKGIEISLGAFRRLVTSTTRFLAEMVTKQLFEMFATH